MKTRCIVFLGTRSFPLEMDEEIVTAKTMGLDILMVSSAPEIYSKYKLKWSIYAPLGHYTKACTLITAFLKTNRIQAQGIVAWTDREVELVSLLATTLDLPATSIQTAILVRDKSQTRDSIGKINPQLNPRYAVIASKHELKDALSKVGTPCLLKPCGNSGGRGIHKIDCLEKACDQFDKYIAYNRTQKGDMYTYYQGKLLLEEYIEGTEHSLAGFINNGEIHFFSIADKRIDKSISFQYENIIPSLLPVETQQKVKDIARNVLGHMGLDWCGFHVDFIHSDAGVKILEIGGRLGGECINSHLIPYAYNGLSPYTLVLRTAMGEMLEFKDPVPNYRVGIRTLYAAKKGIITCIKGMDDVKNDPRVRRVVQLRDAGDQVAPPRELYDSCRIVSFIATCALDEDLQEILDEIATKVTIEIV